MKTTSDKHSKAASGPAGTTPERHCGPEWSTWINPVGGLGDTLMVSGVLKQVIERHPGRRFRLVRRPNYMSILEGHPAITGIGFPSPDAEIITTDYWSHESLGSGRQRPMQVLGRMFGLDEEVEERFCMIGDDEPDPLMDMIPWLPMSVVIAPGSCSPRKEWSHDKWECLAGKLREAGAFVLQVGDAGSRYVRPAYSILGLTRPKQVFPVLRRASVVVTVDCFIMHAAHHVGLPAVVLWGPTQPEVYGYEGQVHLRAGEDCEKPDDCLGPGKGRNYGTPCPRLHEHCVDAVTVGTVYREVENLLSSKHSTTK